MSDHERHPDAPQARRDELEALLPPLDEGAGPAHRISSRAADQMIDRVMARAAASAPAHASTPAPAPTPAMAIDDDEPRPVLAAARRRRRRSPRAIIALVAAVALVGVASASVYMLSRDQSVATTEPPSRVVPRAPASVPRAVPAVRVEPAPVEEPAPKAAVPAKRLVPRARRAPRRSRAQVAEDFLRKANAARRARRWRVANRLYRRVRARNPGSTAAYVATVASAALELEKLGHARRALSLYRAALRGRPHGSLAHEARWGVAEAARALGDHPLERRTLRDFIARHPRSPLGSRARSRLRQLGK